ncbi:hypothetical protein PIB30_067487 [Stylosanthes scabra]|uniref:Vacuolar protein sorting-associated protein 13 DH-like domain-containing protein n=1 Tax=Stylosanthes scabra TaxID=79078 RepID=A0ABU6YLJ3_9FABA|nr:hypothetical protein [Stylosanthes scabra]
MRQSSMVSMAVSNIRKDLLGQPFQLLSSVDILSNASSALGHMSKGVAALSMDKKFIQSRMRQESKGVEDFGNVLREGGGALAKGLFRGVTGILIRPLQGAKSSSVEDFVQGVGKGIIGATAQPVSGVLDLLSKTEAIDVQRNGEQRTWGSKFPEARPTKHPNHLSKAWGTRGFSGQKPGYRPTVFHSNKSHCITPNLPFQGLGAFSVWAF